MSRITLTIDRLVLKGLEGADRKALAEGLQKELSRVLADPATRAEWASSHRTPILRLGQMALDPGPAGGRKFGGGLARAIGKGLKP
jgi:hypothetical protein